MDESHIYSDVLKLRQSLPSERDKDECRLILDNVYNVLNVSYEERVVPGNDAENKIKLHSPESISDAAPEACVSKHASSSKTKKQRTMVSPSTPMYSQVLCTTEDSPCKSLQECENKNYRVSPKKLFNFVHIAVCEPILEMHNNEHAVQHGLDRLDVPPENSVNCTVCHTRRLDIQKNDTDEVLFMSTDTICSPKTTCFKNMKEHEPNQHVIHTERQRKEKRNTNDHKMEAVEPPEK